MGRKIPKVRTSPLVYSDKLSCFVYRVILPVNHAVTCRVYKSKEEEAKIEYNKQIKMLELRYGSVIIPKHVETTNGLSEQKD